MKRNISYLKIGLVLLSFGLLYSCGDSTTGADEGLIDEEEVVVQEINKNYSKFSMPPPVDLFITMWEMEFKFSKEAVNSPDNLKNYNTTVKKAVGLGAYSSDLSYTSVYGQNQLTMNYFTVTKKLADDLGLTEGFNGEIVDRINRNMDNADSLYNITTDSYSEAVSHLENSGQAHLLPYIVFGGWIESAYIAAIAGDVNKAEDVSLNTFSEQGLLLENLLDYYKNIDQNDDVKNILNDLNSIYNFYNEALNSEDMMLTEEQFENIKKQIIIIREKWLI